MRVEIQLRIVGDDGTVISDGAVLRLERADHRLAVVGLSLAEAKTLLADVQNRLVAAQASDYVARQRPCSACGRRRPIKGYETIAFRTAFGVVRLPSPRLIHCGCQAAEAKTFSPLTTLLTEHTAPELLYLESKFASLVSYGLMADLLQEVLPIGTTANASTIRNHLHRVARRCDADLGAEQAGFIGGCPADWKELPIPEGPRSSSASTAAMSATGPTRRPASRSSSASRCPRTGTTAISAACRRSTTGRSAGSSRSCAGRACG